MLSYQAVDHSTLTPVDPKIFKSQKGTEPDEPGLIEALSIPQYEQWTESMTEEITILIKRRTWDVIQKYEVTDGVNIIPGTWAFKCKHFPDWSFQKFKAWFCVRGDIMKELYDIPMNTYDPVLQWYMVMLMMFLNCIMGLNTISTEFRNAFAQADLKQIVYLQ